MEHLTDIYNRTVMGQDQCWHGCSHGWKPHLQVFPHNGMWCIQKALFFAASSSVPEQNNKKQQMDEPSAYRFCKPKVHKSGVWICAIAPRSRRKLDHVNYEPLRETSPEMAEMVAQWLTNWANDRKVTREKALESQASKKSPEVVNKISLVCAALIGRLRTHWRVAVIEEQL